MKDRQDQTASYRPRPLVGIYDDMFAVGTIQSAIALVIFAVMAACLVIIAASLVLR